MKEENQKERTDGLFLTGLQHRHNLIYQSVFMTCRVIAMVQPDVQSISFGIKTHKVPAMQNHQHQFLNVASQEATGMLEAVKKLITIHGLAQSYSTWVAVVTETAWKQTVPQSKKKIVNRYYRM